MDYQEIKLPTIEDLIAQAPKAEQIQQVYAPASFANASEITLKSLINHDKKLASNDAPREEFKLGDYLTLTNAVTGEVVPYTDVVLEKKTGVYVNPQPSEGENDTVLLNIDGLKQETLFDEMTAFGLDTQKFKEYYDSANIHAITKDRTSASPYKQGYEAFNYVNLADHAVESSGTNAQVLHSYMHLSHEIGHKHIHQEKKSLEFRDKMLAYKAEDSSVEATARAYERGEGRSLEHDFLKEIMSRENYSVAFSVIAIAKAVEHVDGGREMYQGAFNIEKEMRLNEMKEMASWGQLNTHYVYPSLMAANAYVQNNFGSLSNKSSQELQQVAITISEKTLNHPLNEQFLYTPSNQAQLAKGATIPSRYINTIALDAVASLDSVSEPKISLGGDKVDNVPSDTLEALRMHR